MATTHFSKRVGIQGRKENEAVEMAFYQIIGLLCCFSAGKNILSYIFLSFNFFNMGY